MKYELVLIKTDGSEEVIHRNLTERRAIELFEGIDNTYYREQKRRMRFGTWCRKDPDDTTLIAYTFTDSDGETSYFTSEDECSYSFLGRLRNAWIESIDLVENEFGKQWNAVLYED